MKSSLSRRFFHHFWKNLRDTATTFFTVALLLAGLAFPALMAGFVTHFLLAPRVSENVEIAATLIVAVVFVLLTGLAAYSYAQAAEE